MFTVLTDEKRMNMSVQTDNISFKMFIQARTNSDWLDVINLMLLLDTQRVM